MIEMISLVIFIISGVLVMIGGTYFRSGKAIAKLFQVGLLLMIGDIVAGFIWYLHELEMFVLASLLGIVSLFAYVLALAIMYIYLHSQIYMTREEARALMSSYAPFFLLLGTEITLTTLELMHLMIESVLLGIILALSVGLMRITIRIKKHRTKAAKMWIALFVFVLFRALYSAFSIVTMFLIHLGEHVAEYLDVAMMSLLLTSTLVLISSVLYFLAGLQYKKMLSILEGS